jgi:uncharacterized protein YciI
MLIYHYVDDILERRDPVRAAHQAHWTSFLPNGLAGAGPCLNPVDIGVYVFTTTDRAAIEEGVRGDPYMEAGLVKSYEIREFMVTIGQDPAPAEP